MRKEVFAILILFLVSLPSVNPILASPVRPTQEQETAQAPPPDPRAEVVRAFLGLDEDQFRSLLTLLRSRSETIGPLLRTLGEQGRELARLLREENPDPVAVGSVMITLRGTREQIKAAQDTFRSGFMSILTQAQKRRLAGLERFVENQVAAPAFLSLGLIEVTLGPEPQKTIRNALGLDMLQ